MKKAELRHLRQYREQFDPDQAWIWTAEWQDQIRESLVNLERGCFERFDSAGDFLSSLQSVDRER